MSVINFINEENITLIQGVNGICLCNEGWMMQRKRDCKDMENK
ncbi:hypothetical protein [Prevotella sp. OH937_COT-195]|nr:hypothetical protein [Prevotella sp. OH937_COT-195]